MVPHRPAIDRTVRPTVARPHPPAVTYRGTCEATHPATTGVAATRQDRPTSTENGVTAGLIVSGTVAVLTLGAAFTLLAPEGRPFWVVFPAGFGGVFPIASGLVALTTSADRD